MNQIFNKSSHNTIIEIGLKIVLCNKIDNLIYWMLLL